MKIIKLGHCCLVIEEKGLRILTDPGNFTTEQNEVVGIDIVLITHEHADHLHIDSLKQVLLNNPGTIVVTNSGVGKILDEHGISYTLVEEGQSLEHGSLLIEGHGQKHAEIYEDFGMVQNTGYFIAGKLFYPGDALYNPGKQVEILALPVAGPWLKTSEAVNYTKEIKPGICFPVHDGMINELGTAFQKVPASVLSEAGISFRPLSSGETFEVN